MSAKKFGTRSTSLLGKIDRKVRKVPLNPKYRYTFPFVAEMLFGNRFTSVERRGRGRPRHMVWESRSLPHWAVFFRPSRACSFSVPSHDLRRRLHFFAAPRLSAGEPSVFQGSSSTGFRRLTSGLKPPTRYEPSFKNVATLFDKLGQAWCARQRASPKVKILMPLTLPAGRPSCLLCGKGGESRKPAC